jgi:hypothetical protein
VINRAAVILKYREPAVRWINEADPSCDDPGMTLDTVNRERTVYLIGDEHAESRAAMYSWVERHYRELFEAELEGWYTDSQLWPRERTFRLFQAWFDVECHSAVVDMAEGDIYDDEF